MSGIPEFARHTSPENPAPKAGVLTILTGPTAVGKTSVLDGVLQQYPSMKRVVTSTTRLPRDGEQDGVDYHFLSKESFISKMDDGSFLEANEYAGNMYGTLKDDVMPVMEGEDRIWSLNIQRASEMGQVFDSSFDPEFARLLNERTLLVFVGIPSMLALRDRYKRRGDPDGFIVRAREDWAEWKQYKDHFPHVIINREMQLGTAVSSLVDLIDMKKTELTDNAFKKEV